MCRTIRFPELLGYMIVDPYGNYHFKENCPEHLKEMIRKEWPAYKQEVIEKHKRGEEDSRDWF